MANRRSERTGWQRAVLTVLCLHALVVQGIWSGAMPMSLAPAFDPMASICFADGSHGSASGQDTNQPGDQPADHQSSPCCVLFCRAGALGGPPAVLPEPVAAFQPALGAAAPVIPRVIANLPAPLRISGGARAPPIMA
ncbi:DUF2946 family protein [Skermanella stibiiresistens]|uniref:DUF2946 family protein n=1 Tax=Skermanella stibiiresistens TaxID=913326 RepID=UPI0018DE44E5|nr:DUF2946 family protein [Skermanella stibiiresistens]